MTRGNAESGPAARSARLRREHIPVLMLLVGVVAALLVLDPWGWAGLLIDGGWPVGLLAAAAGWGAWPVLWLGLGRRSGLQQFCVATALGLGILSTAALGLGVVGGLGRVVVWGLVAAGWGAGLGRLYCRQGGGQASGDVAGGPSRAVLIASGGALLALAVPAAIALFGACLPPGAIWTGEARGYDALEYHLEGPREYWQQGRIEFLPNNVYTSFPQQMEMQYLLLNHLCDGPLRGATPAQLFHVLCGILAVVAVVAWSPRGWPRIVAAIVAGSVPWVAYVACLAYVECGLLFFAAVAAGLVLDHYRDELKCDWRVALAAGLCAGLAGGCKYTALVFVAVALAVAWGVTMRGGLALRSRRLGLFTAGVIVAFGPWMIRNAAFTGNPVYPFAYRWFGGAAWSAEQDAQWARGHAPPAEDATLAGRAALANRELFSAELFNPLAFLLAAWGLILARSRAAVGLAIWFGLIVVAWVAFTQIAGRFAMPVVVPLALLAAYGVPGWRRLGTKTTAQEQWHAGRRVVTAIVVILAVVGGGRAAVVLGRLLHAENTRWERLTKLDLATLAVHGPHSFAAWEPLNNPEYIPRRAYLWLVGDAAPFYIQRRLHYTVVFDRDPWLEYAKGATPAEAVEWLRTAKVTHVVFSWPEIERLRSTYGFPELVTPAWVAALAEVGLRHVELPEDAGDPRRDVYEVVPR